MPTLSYISKESLDSFISAWRKAALKQGDAALRTHDPRLREYFLTQGNAIAAVLNSLEDFTQGNSITPEIPNENAKVSP